MLSAAEKRLRLNEISKEKYNNYFPNKHQLRSSGFHLFKDDFGRILKEDKTDYINFDLTKKKDVVTVKSNSYKYLLNQDCCPLDINHYIEKTDICNSCNKKFVVPDSAITASGRTVQCGSCGSKWKQFPPTGINTVVTNFQSTKSKKIKETPIKTKNKKKKRSRDIDLYSPEYLAAARRCSASA